MTIHHFRFVNPGFLEEDIFCNKPDIVESHITKDCVKKNANIIRGQSSSSFTSEDEVEDTEQLKDDLSTDALKLQMYDEIVQRFGPDEQFSEMLRSEGTLNRIKSKNSNDLTISSNPITSLQSEPNDSIENVLPSRHEKVEVLLMSQIPETHRSSYHSLIISPNNS